MPEFKVGWTYEVGGYTNIEAVDEQSAHYLIMEKLSEGGEEDILRLDTKVTHRDYNAFDVEEL